MKQGTSVTRFLKCMYAITIYACPWHHENVYIIQYSIYIYIYIYSNIFWQLRRWWWWWYISYKLLKKRKNKVA